jgi:hypothetical protein
MPLSCCSASGSRKDGCCADELTAAAATGRNAATFQKREEEWFISLAVLSEVNSIPELSLALAAEGQHWYKRHTSASPGFLVLIYVPNPTHTLRRSIQAHGRTFASLLFDP